MKVLFAGGGTGGHILPALAIAEALVERDPRIEPVFVGAERGVEATLLPKRQYRHYLLPFQPIHRRSIVKNLRWPILAFRLLLDCDRVLRQERPVFVVGTGGYAAGPILFQAKLRRIPFALQEQNAFPGITTRLLARWSAQIHLGFPEAADRLQPGPTTHVHVFGNPIQPPPECRLSRAAARTALGIEADAPVLLVMGGSQGALRINEVIAQVLDSQKLDDAVFLWSTGPKHFERFRVYERAPTRQIRAFWDPIAEAYQAADLVIARAGAMTIAELLVWGLPSILVPLPTAAADHQTKNAEALHAAGAAIHLAESGLSPDRLARTVRELLDAPDRVCQMGTSAQARARPDAAKKIAAELLSLS